MVAFWNLTKIKHLYLISLKMFVDPGESLQEGINEPKKLKCFQEVVVEYSSEKSILDNHLYAL